MQRLLSDVAVVELAEGVVGGYCGKMFADLGADVVKVERPEGDPLRRLPWGPTAPDGTRRSGAFLHFATNKRSVVVDPSSPGAVDRLWSLLAEADLVIEAPERGSLASYGLSWEQVHERLPRLVVVCITGFGATGPYAGYGWSDLVAQAASGTMLLQDDPDQDPVKLPGHLASCMVANIAALGGLGGVLAARASGVGSFVDCAASEALATQPLKATWLLAYQYWAGNLVGAPGTSAASTLIPMGVFPCGDGHVAMMSTPQQLEELLDVLDDDDLRAAFARPDAFERPETKEAIDAALYPWLFARTRAEITAAAQARGWPLAGVNTPEEVLRADHLHQRGFWVHVDDPVAGAVDLPGPPTRFAEGGFSVRRLAPSLGEHDAETAREVGTTGTGDGAARDETSGVASVGSVAVPATPPLAGVRVVDLTAVWSGPYATMLLADLGAEVIRVENPFVLPPTTKGYQARPTLASAGALGDLYGPRDPERPDRPYNRHAMNNSLARNKLSVTIDTRQDEGRELLYRLVERSDVVVDNFKANGLARIGVQLSELQRRNPRLVVVRMPPTGTTGDWAHYTGFGAQFDGLSGLLWLCGHPDADLVQTPWTTYMDGASGPAAAFAAVAALRYRDATGRGQVVEVVQLENVVQHLGDVMVDAQLGVPPARFGNRDRAYAPQGIYRCRDDEPGGDRDDGPGERRWLAVSVTGDREWAALAKVVGRPELADDARFADPPSRQAHHDELDELLAGWAAGEDAVEAFHALQAEGVAAAPIMSTAAFSEDPQIRARDWLQPLHSPDVGTYRHPGLPYRGVPQVWSHGSPSLGQHNDYVYREILGVSDEDFERYRAAHILADDYLDPDGRPC